MNKKLARVLLVLFIYAIFVIANLIGDASILESLLLSLIAVIVIPIVIIGFWLFIWLVEQSAVD